MRDASSCSLADKRSACPPFPTLSEASARALLVSCSLGSPSRFCRSFLSGLCYVLCSMHHLLAQHLLAQLEHLRLPSNEVGLNLRQFLRFPYMNDLAGTHERI